MRAPGVRGADPAGTFADNAQRVVEARLEELHASARRAFDPAQAEPLHVVRLAAERLHDALELAGPVVGPYAAEAAGPIAALAGLVGELETCDALTPRVLAVLEALRAEDAAAVVERAGHHGEPDPAFAAGAPNAHAYAGLELLLVHLRARREILFERFLRCFTDLERDGLRARLLHALAERPATTPSSA